MSSILKALKKLEQEKAVRKPDSFRIDSEILRGNVDRRPVTTGASLAAIVLFLCGVAVTYLIMRQDSASAPQSHTPTIETRGETSSAATLLPVPLKTATEPQARLPEKMSSTVDEPLPPSRPAGKQQPPIQKPSEAPLKPAPPPAPLPAVSTVPSTQPATPLPVPVKPVLKVLGIAYQEGTESAAMINGVTVTKGSVIEGVRVEEIKKDRVTFSQSGETFEIILKSD